MEKGDVDKMKLYIMVGVLARMKKIKPWKLGYEVAKTVANIGDHEKFMAEMTDGHISYLEEVGDPGAKVARDNFEAVKEKSPHINK